MSSTPYIGGVKITGQKMDETNLPHPLNSLDLVQIKTVENVKWLSGPKGTKPSPHGVWSISHFLGGDAIIAKDGTLVRIPVSDIQRVGTLTLNRVYEQLANAGKKAEYIDMIDVIAKEFEWDHMEAKMFLKRYGLPTDAQNQEHKEKVLSRARELAEENEEI